MPFRTIVGHRRLLSLLARAIARDSMPPAVLMAGPAGVGKRLSAIAVAQAINCLQPRSPVHRSSNDDGGPGGLERDACGECASCRRIARGVHPDVIIVEPGETGSISVDQLRDIIDRSQYRPFEGRRRVVIIDEADAAGGPAQSALLKTLEEPPSASVFILVSSMPDALLATVQSRCPRLRFGPLTPAEVAQVLMRDHAYSETDARAAAADAGGSIRRALEAESMDVTEAREAAQQLLQETARSTDPARRINLARDLTGGKRTPAEERNRLAVRLRSLGSLLRDIAIIASRAERRAASLRRQHPGLELDYVGRSIDHRVAHLAHARVGSRLPRDLRADAGRVAGGDGNEGLRHAVT